MALSNINKTENFFIEGSGTAHVLGDNGRLSLIHLQNMSLELSSTMENIYGGESNFSLYSYNTEKGAKVTFTNASWNLDIMNLTQGVKSDTSPVFFKQEDVATDGNGVLTVTNSAIDWSSALIYDANNNLVEISSYGSGTTITNATVGSGHGNETLTAFYTYTGDSSTGISTSLFTTGVPGFVTIYHKSKPMKQKNGRIIRVYTTIYKARCDGSMTIDFQHKNAFAPELAFECVDPERDDGKYITFGIKDTTVEDANNANLVSGN